MNMEKEQITLGTKAIYWDIVGEDGDKDNGSIVTIISNAWQHSHDQWVCKLENKTGCFDISHLEPFTESNIEGFLNWLVDEYYALDREKADLERRTKKKKEELETAMGLAGVQKAFGTEVGYSMSIRPKVTYDPKVWQLLGEKAELFREEPKITQKRIDELLKEGDITKADLDVINSCKEVDDASISLLKIKKED